MNTRVNQAVLTTQGNVVKYYKEHICQKECLVMSQNLLA